jgi:archaellum component FlaG (FlaF/FlaG flagellin family)
MILCAGLLLGFAVTTSAPTVFAATDVTGAWTAQMQGPDGDMTLTFHLKQDGDKLTGTVDAGMGGDPIEIINGKIDGDKISFDTSFNGMTINHAGTIGADEIKLNVKSDGGQMPSRDITLKRSK